MADKTDEKEVESNLTYNKVLASVYKCEAWNKILRHCDLEIFEVNQKIASLNHQLRVLFERKEFLLNKLSILEQKLNGKEEDD